MAHLTRRRKYTLTEEQRHMYASEKVMNFRWISKILATYAPETLSSEHLATSELQNYLSDIGQFAEVAYNLIPIQFVFDNLPTLLEPGFPFEEYTALAGAELVSSFIGNTAHLPGFVAYRPETKQLVLAISGTSAESAMQALYDVHTLRHRHPCGRGKVHAGFWRLYKGIKSFALDGVRKGLSLHDVGQFVITGHSMGAAVSQLFLLDIMRDESLLPLGDIPIHFVGFGGPRVGTKSIVEFWRELLVQRREKYGKDAVTEYAVKMYNDGVPALPPRAFGYRHFTQTPLYFVHGRLYHVPAAMCEYSLFHVEGLEDEEPPMHPRGGHNYYNGRDMEKCARLIGWLDKATKKEGDWKDTYRAKVAKHNRKR